MLEDIQSTGKPKGVDGVDFFKVKGDEIPEVQKIFKGTELDPKTYYYTTDVAEEKPFGPGKINSVTVLNDFKNRVNKNHQLFQVFRKLEDANDRQNVDPAQYYFTNALGDGITKNTLNNLQANKAANDTNIKDIYNNVKGDMTNKPEDDEYVYLIKVKGDKDVNDALNKIKGAEPLKSKPKKPPQKVPIEYKPTEDDFKLNSIKGDTKMKQIYDRVNQPDDPTENNGALLIKCAGDTDFNDVLGYAQNSGLLDKKPEDSEPYPPSISQYKSLNSPANQKFDTPLYCTRIKGDSDKKPENCNIESIVIPQGQFSKLEKPNDQFGKMKLDEILRAANPDNEKEGPNPQYYFVQLKGDMSNKPNKDIQLYQTLGNNDLKDIYEKCKLKGGISNKPDEGILLMKTTGYPDDTILKNYVKQSQPMYRPADNKEDELPLESFYATAPAGTIIGKPTTVKGDDDLKYMVVNGDLLAKNKLPGKLNDLFRAEPSKKKPIEPPTFYYRTISNPTKPSDSQLINVPGETTVDELYKTLKDAGIMSKKPGEGVQIFKVTGPADGNDLGKHISESEGLYRKPNLPDEDQVRVQSIKLCPQGKDNEKDSTFYIKLSGWNRPDEYYKTPGDTDLSNILQQVKEKGKPERDGKPYDTVTGDELDSVIKYFKPISDDLTKPKLKDEDTEPRAYFYTSKIIGKPEENSPNLIQSVTLLNDPENTLNKGKPVERLFKQTYGDLKPDYYYTPFKCDDKEDKIDLQPCNENSKIGEIFDNIKNKGVNMAKDGEGFQIVKTLGKIKPEDMNDHALKARKLSRFPDESGRIPPTYYYKTQAPSEGASKPGESGRKGKVDSVTIKRDPNNSLNNGKDVETVFKEGEEEEDQGNDLGTPEYYYKKIKGGITEKPEEMQIFKAGQDSKTNDIYNQIKKLGPVNKHDGVQLFKVSGDVDTNNLLDHAKEAGELFNNPEDDAKSDEPTTSYYTTEVMGAKAKPGEIPGTIESVTVQAPCDINRNNLVGKVFHMEDPNSIINDAERGDIPNPVFYYTKVSGDSKNKPGDIQLVKVAPNEDIRDVVTYASKDNKDDTVIVKAPEDKDKDEILRELKSAGVTTKKDDDMNRPTNLEAMVDGNPLDFYEIGKQPEPEEEEEKDDGKNMETLSSSAESENAVPLDNEIADNKVPKEMVRDIMKYSLGTIDQITVAPTSNEFLAKKTTFGDTITKTLQNDNNDSENLLTGLHSLGNYLFSENGPNYSKLDLAKTYNLLHELQSKYYANPEILTQVNSIAGSLVKNLKDDPKGLEYTKRFYDLIPESTKCQDNNPDLVLLSMKLMHDSLEKKPVLVDEAFDETVPVVLSLMKLYKDNPEIQEKGYSILSQFAKNKVYAAALVNNGILPTIKETLENAVFSDMIKESKPIKAEVFKLLSNISQDDTNSPKIADEIMGQLIQDLNDKGIDDDGNGQEIVTLLNTLLNNKDTVAPFVQYGGIDACVKLLDQNDSNVELAQKLFQIFKKVANANDEYKRMLQNKKLPDIVNRVIKKVGVYDKKLEYEGRQLIFTTNLCKIELEDPNKIVVDDIKVVEPIPPEVRNFLTSGKQVKVINEQGDIKDMQLIFTQDLMRVSAKKIKSNLPPKPKYIIDTLTIKKVLKGHGTDAFKKSKGLFRKIPKPEVCFSIIGPTTVDGMKALNVECESEKDVDRWIKYLQIVINYFKKTKGIKGNVLIKK